MIKIHTKSNMMRSVKRISNVKYNESGFENSTIEVSFLEGNTIRNL